jgi:hypothetical protein
VIIKIGNLPCTGTIDRKPFCSDVIDNISYWRPQYSDYGCVIDGDFTSVLDSQAPYSKYITAFLKENKLSRFDILYLCSVELTYITEYNTIQ